MCYQNLVLEQFFHPAETDYLAARLLFGHDLLSQFLWLSGQSLEKYLKSALLLRNKCVRKQHKLVYHFEELRNCTDYHGPEYLKRNQNVSRYSMFENEKGDLYHLEYNEKLGAFLQRLEDMSHPDQRYGRVGHSVETYDLFKLDQVVRVLREHTVKLFNRKNQFTINQSRFGKIELAKLPNASLEFFQLGNEEFFPEQEMISEKSMPMIFSDQDPFAGLAKNDKWVRSAQAILDERIKR
jgi:HEPN domain-containing protein